MKLHSKKILLNNKFSSYPNNLLFYFDARNDLIDNTWISRINKNHYLTFQSQPTLDLDDHSLIISNNKATLSTSFDVNNELCIAICAKLNQSTFGSNQAFHFYKNGYSDLRNFFSHFPYNNSTIYFDRMESTLTSNSYTAYNRLNNSITNVISLSDFQQYYCIFLWKAKGTYGEVRCIYPVENYISSNTFSNWGNMTLNATIFTSSIYWKVKYIMIFNNVDLVDKSLINSIFNI